MLWGWYCSINGPTSGVFTQTAALVIIPGSQLTSSTPACTVDSTVDSKVDSTVQYSTVQYSTVQYSTVQYSTVQYTDFNFYDTLYIMHWSEQYIKQCTLHSKHYSTF